MTIKPDTPGASRVATHEALRIVFFEAEAAHALEPQRRFELTEALLQAGYQVTRPTAQGHVSAPDATTVVVLGRFDGALPTFDGFEGARVEALDIGAQPLEDVLAKVAGFRTQEGLPQPGAWTPWFPVIDFQRCTNCMQCLSFCLFDVYGVDENGTIEVRNEDKCKTSCPACSRVCPEVAILFPKYKKGPINGDVVRAEDIQKESMKVDISALLGGDIYSSLRSRSTDARKRFSTERDESRALLERKRCLKELQEQLDIPDEVLMTLPSAGDIEDRAQRAKEKLERRKERSQSMKDAQAAAPPNEEEWGI